MRRRLLAGLAAAAFVLGGMGLSAMPAAAAACQGLTNIGTHTSGGVWDGYAWNYVSITVYHGLDQPHDSCYYYSEQTWNSANVAEYANPIAIRVWRCGGYIGTWTAITWFQNTGVIGGYGVCGPQADDSGSSVKSHYGSYYVSPYVRW